MSGTLDPYHRWLGIPSEEQPPHHYRLLGLAPFEDSPEVIRDAAERQMAHVRGYGLGPHADLSNKILNELAAAKACLLDPAKKADYDQHLRQELLPSEPVPPPRAADTSKPPKIAGRAAVRTKLSTEIPKTAVATTQAIDFDHRGSSRPGAPLWKSPLVIGAAIGLVFLAVLSVIGSRAGNAKTPRVLPIEHQIVSEGTELRFFVRVEDPGVPSAELRYGLGPGSPEGARIDAKTGQFAWTPTEEHGPGKHTIAVKVFATGSSGLGDEATFRVDVQEVNQAPVIQPVEDQIVKVGEESRFSVTATDPDQPPNTVTFSLGEKPIGARIDPSGTFTWTPTQRQVGDHSVALRVTDDGPGRLQDEQPLTIAVTRPRLPQDKISQLLSDAQDAMESRDWEKAWMHVKAARKAAKSHAEVQKVKPVEKMLRLMLLEVFRTAVRDEFGSLHGLEQLKLGRDVIASVVEASGDKLEIKWQGRSAAYTADQLPWELAVALAQRRLPQDDPTTVLCIASFLASGAQGDPEEARRRRERAGLVGEELSGLTGGVWEPEPTPPAPEPPEPEDDPSEMTIIEGTITLDLEKKVQVYTLETDRQLDGELYGEISGLNSWPIPATLKESQNRVRIPGKLIIIKPTEVPSVEIRVKFLHYNDLKLRIEVKYGSLDLTTGWVESQCKNLPGQLKQAIAEIANLNGDLQQANASLAAIRRLPPTRDQHEFGRRAMRADWLTKLIMRHSKRLKSLTQRQVPDKRARLQKLPALRELVNSLHNSAELKYRVFAKADGEEAGSNRPSVSTESSSPAR